MLKKKRQPKTNSALVKSSPDVATSAQMNSLKLYANELFNRMTLAYSAAGNIGVTHGGARDLYTILGYKKELEFNDFLWRYERQDIATRIVTAFPSACWSMKPKVLESDTPISETPFEKAFANIVLKNKAFKYLALADALSGIGRFGIVVLGFADGKKLDQPATKKKDMKLSYIRPYHEGSVAIQSLEPDTQNERYGLPTSYKVTTSLNEIANISPSGTAYKSEFIVHWTRVIHVLPELGSQNDIFGEPRLKNVYNRLQDIDQIAGGSSEMFWRGAFGGLAFKNDEGATMDETGKAALEAEMNEYINNMKRTIKLQNMDVKELNPTVSDPKNPLDAQLMLVSSAKGMPKRILIGAEQGELASSQDEINWNKRVDERRIDQCELELLRPFIDKLIEYGVLPEPQEEYRVEWPDLYTPSGLDRAKVAESLMRAVKDWLSMPEGQMIIPKKVFLEKIMNFTESEVEQCFEIIDNMSQEEIDEIRKEEDANIDNNVI